MTRILNEMDADLYDYFATGQNGDVSFYLDEARKANGQVLELGCGTGRILIPVAEAGVSIFGIDNSPAMLKVARRKISGMCQDARQRIQCVEGDMRSFELDRKFDLVIIPYRSFMFMLTLDDRRKALACIHDHLLDHGRLIFNFFDPGVDEIATNSRSAGGILKYVRSFDHSVSGNRFALHESKQFDPEEQTLDWFMFFEETNPDGRLISKTSLALNFHYFNRYEVQHLLELYGFEIEALYGDFQRGPFRHGNEQIWVASKTNKVRGH